MRDLEGENLARERLGTTAEERLRWVVNFSQRDLERLRPEERAALGYDLRIMIPKGWQIVRRVGPMPDSDLRARQKEIAEGVRALLKDLSETWRLPVVRRAYLTRVQEAGAKFPRIQLTWEGTEAEGIIGGVVDLLLQAGERLRACGERECRKPFVARKRQAYCSPACSQRTRDRRKRKG